MTGPVIVMIVIGMIIIIVSFFLSEKMMDKGEEPLHSNLMTVDDEYEFSERELRIIRRKIEDVIVNQAKDILYETNESLSSMANEKTLALGDYAVAVCEEIEKNHKEVMFLYSMLDDKQKEIMKTVNIINDVNKEIRETVEMVRQLDMKRAERSVESPKQAVNNQLTSLSKMKEAADYEATTQDTMSVKEKQPIVQSVTNFEDEKLMDDAIRAMQEAGKHADDKNSLHSEFDEMDDVFAELDQTEVDFDDVLTDETDENENLNDIILEMHRNGNSLIDIAKQLGLGVGEVKLVVDLYQGE